MAMTVGSGCSRVKYYNARNHRLWIIRVAREAAVLVPLVDFARQLGQVVLKLRAVALHWHAVDSCTVPTRNECYENYCLACYSIHPRFAQTNRQRYNDKITSNAWLLITVVLLQ